MTQTEKTEALKELRLWLLDGHLRLTTYDLELLKKELFRILENKEAEAISENAESLVPTDNITIKVYTALLKKGVTLSYNGYEVYYEDEQYHAVSNSNGHAQVVSNTVTILETVGLL